MKNNTTFITGNQNKADYLSKYLGFPVQHKKLDLDELQSMNLQEIVEHKVKQAFDIVQSPVIVEDVSLEFEALGGLPGPFIKFFVDNNDLQTVCDMMPTDIRTAVAKCVFGYYDGNILELFEGELPGKIAIKPAGQKGYGWDSIFIPQGYEKTRAELSQQDDKKTYLQIKPFEKLKSFLESQ